MIVIEGVMKDKADELLPPPEDEAQVRSYLSKHSFVQMMLTEASKVFPYHEGSDISQIKVPAARDEITRYAQIPSKYTIDHIFLTTAGKV